MRMIYRVTLLNCFYKHIIIVALCLGLGSCKSRDTTSVIDSNLQLTRKDYEEALIKKKSKGDSDTGLDVISSQKTPALSKLLVVPPPPPMGNGELISFSVTEEVPLKDVIIELGRIADVDIEVDPGISGGIILKITQKPLDVVIARICDLGNLRYTYNDGILRFERDTPFTVYYTLDFLVENDVWNDLQSSVEDIIKSKSNGEDDDGSYVSISKPVSILTVHASAKAQRAIVEYLNNVKKNYSAQVLIEAKIIEVTLSKEFQAGIDWSFMNKSSTSGGEINISGAPTVSQGLTIGTITGPIFGGDISATVAAMEKFGTTRTLSSPRVHAINNQKASLEFVNKLVYFSVEKEEEEFNETDRTKTTYTSTKQEDEEGVTLAITPSVNLVTQEITMNVVPELRVVVEYVQDPNPDVENRVPVIQSRKMETSLKIKSGNVLVIGGLMTENSNNEDTGVPFLAGLPIVGNLFKNINRNNEVREMVIFIKATIINPDGSVDDTDRQLFRTFSGDRSNFL